MGHDPAIVDDDEQAKVDFNVATLLSALLRPLCA